MGAIISLPAAGRAVARRGSRTAITLGLPAFAALLPALALAPTLPALAVLLFVFGAAGGAVDVAMNAHALAVERRYERPVLSSFHASWSFGGLAGAGTAALAAARGVDPALHFAASALVLGVVGVAVSRLLLPAAADRPERAVAFLLPRGGLLALALLAFAGLFAESAAESWSAVYIAGPLDAAPSVAALGFAGFSLAMALVRLVADRLVARFGPVGVTRAGGLVAASGLALALLADHALAAIAGFTAMGAGLAGTVPILFRAAGSLAGVPAGVGIAALTTVGYTAFLVGPPVIGFSAELLGLANALWLVVAFLAVLAALASWAKPGATD